MTRCKSSSNRWACVCMSTVDCGAAVDVASASAASRADICSSAKQSTIIIVCGNQVYLRVQSRIQSRVCRRVMINIDPILYCEHHGDALSRCTSNYIAMCLQAC